MPLNCVLYKGYLKVGLLCSLPGAVHPGNASLEVDQGDPSKLLSKGIGAHVRFGEDACRRSPGATMASSIRNSVQESFAPVDSERRSKD